MIAWLYPILIIKDYYDSTFGKKTHNILDKERDYVDDTNQDKICYSFFMQLNCNPNMEILKLIVFLLYPRYFLFQPSISIISYILKRSINLILILQ